MKTPEERPPKELKLLRLLMATEAPSPHPLRQCFQDDQGRGLDNFLNSAAKAVGIMTLTTAACWLGRDILAPEACCLIYLGVTVLFGAFMPPPAPFLLAAIGLLSWNFFFTPPEYDLRIRSIDELILHILFVMIAAVMNNLTANLRRRERHSRLSEHIANLRRDCQDALAKEDGDAFLSLISEATGGTATLVPTGVTAADPRFVVAKQASGESHQTTLRLEFASPVRPTPQAEELTQALAKLAADHFERRRYMAEAAKAQTATVSERIGRALLDNVTHEIKTPVSFMLASVHRIRSRDQGQHESETRAIAEAANRLVRLTEELTLISSVRTQMLHPRMEHCNAYELANEILAQDVRPEIAAMVQLINKSPEACLSTDPHLAGIILSNFISNACRHSPAGHKVELTVEQQGRQVRLSVSDHGKGVAATDLPHIFDRFYRGDNPGALGLGLSISREIAGIIGANLEISATPGGGATFHMAIAAVEPYKDQEEAAP